jgi:hypothetical protein
MIGTSPNIKWVFLQQSDLPNILGPDTLMWARPNCLLGFPNGMSRPKHGEDHGAWNYPLVLGLLRIVFLGVTIYPTEVVRGGYLKWRHRECPLTEPD